jgi:hypothetical protein
MFNCKRHECYSSVPTAVPCSICTEKRPMKELYGFYVDLPGSKPFVPPGNILLGELKPWRKKYYDLTQVQLRQLFWQEVAKYMYCEKCLQKQKMQLCSVCPDTWVELDWLGCGKCSTPGCRRQSCTGESTCGTCHHIGSLCCIHVQQQTCLKCDVDVVKKNVYPHGWRSPPHGWRSSPYCHCAQHISQCNTCGKAIGCANCIPEPQNTPQQCASCTHKLTTYLQQRKLCYPN